MWAGTQLDLGAKAIKVCGWRGGGVLLSAEDVPGSYHEALLHSLRGRGCLSMKSHMMFLRGAPRPTSCFTSPDLSQGAFCEVTKLAASCQDQRPGQPRTTGHDLGGWKSSFRSGLWTLDRGLEGLRL
ncbi:unnamed protein product [Rangifer tarandus platyrhynchus]|uniref:Uncharacterized protein n=2 Tax=Rangifer tarandus platyrhynchus TaxID=3082113 RepID=A0AC59YPX8_RANTA|nr:unnamed protein product [Rangifer tarandus platyrhynchus]